MLTVPGNNVRDRNNSEIDPRLHERQVGLLSDGGQGLRFGIAATLSNSTTKSVGTEYDFPFGI